VCGFTIDRDIHGAMNILIKLLTEVHRRLHSTSLLPLAGGASIFGRFTTSKTLKA
jgi:transposase